MIAATAADLDGLTIVAGEEAYWSTHHKLGHNVFFGVAMSLVLAAFSTRRTLAFAAYFTCFQLHLLMDYYGSGPEWTIEYLWPISHAGWKTRFAWELSSWQNRAAFGAVLAITVATARGMKRTPLELIAPRLNDRILQWRRRSERRGTSAPNIGL